VPQQQTVFRGNKNGVDIEALVWLLDRPAAGLGL